MHTKLGIRGSALVQVFQARAKCSSRGAGYYSIPPLPEEQFINFLGVAHPDQLESAPVVGGHAVNVLHVGSLSIAGSNAQHRFSDGPSGRGAGMHHVIRPFQPVKRR
jgi:hypothetical protein